MKTITLEIEKDQDFQKIVELAKTLGVRITSQIENEASEREIALIKIKQFYQEKGKNFGDFKFNREEANER